ncbi:hypothetical protein SRABI70_04103 [Pseudomonas sp. Bi70]|nr:hypothetical protein SRABI70_04103 [Pseudomonas sp. Bi70]
MRVEAGAGLCEQIARYAARLDAFPGGNDGSLFVDALAQRRVAAGQVATGHGHRIIAGGRRARLEVAGAGEWLRDPLRADDGAVAGDEVAARLLGKQADADAGGEQRIAQAEAQQADQGQDAGGTQQIAPRHSGLVGHIVHPM